MTYVQLQENIIVQIKKEVVMIFTSLEPKQKRNMPIHCPLFPARQKGEAPYVLGEYIIIIHVLKLLYITAATNVI